MRDVEMNLGPLKSRCCYITREFSVKGTLIFGVLCGSRLQGAVRALREGIRGGVHP